MSDEILKSVFVIGLIVFFFWYALFWPLPEERNLPKEERTPNFFIAYWNTLKH